jgi:hypothetical protein
MATHSESRIEPAVGQVWRYEHREWLGPQRGWKIVSDPASDLRLTRPGVREGDWRGVNVQPREGFPPDFEWLIAREQFEDGRYALIAQTTPTGATVPVPTRAEFIDNLKRTARDV